MGVKQVGRVQFTLAPVHELSASALLNLLLTVLLQGKVDFLLRTKPSKSSAVQMRIEAYGFVAAYVWFKEANLVSHNENATMVIVHLIWHNCQNWG